jgi:hypothetical protein
MSQFKARIFASSDAFLVLLAELHAIKRINTGSASRLTRKERDEG